MDSSLDAPDKLRVFRDAVVEALDAYRTCDGPDDPEWKRYQQCLDMAPEYSSAESIAVQFLKSTDPAKKHLGLDLCIVLAYDDPEKMSGHAHAVIASVRNESSIALYGSAVTALGAMQAEDGVPFLLGALDGRSSELRAATALALAACARNSMVAQRAAIAAIIDSDPKVRMCAALGLASQLEEPSDEVLNALATRLFDSDSGVWEEAVIGLARHGDQRGLEAMKGAVQRPNATERMLTVAKRLGIE